MWWLSCRGCDRSVFRDVVAQLLEMWQLKCRDCGGSVDLGCGGSVDLGCGGSVVKEVLIQLVGDLVS
jgi:hypothetical protein